MLCDRGIHPLHPLTTNTGIKTKQAARSEEGERGVVRQDHSIPSPTHYPKFIKGILILNLMGIDEWKLNTEIK